MTQPAILVDTGPLVALLHRSDNAHSWTRDRFKEHSPPFLTCEAVLSEACFLLRRSGLSAAPVLALLERGVVRIGMSLADEASAIRSLFEKYQNVPASLADACLVRMSELHEPSLVLTLDADFHIYRRHGRKTIPLQRPE